VIGVAVFRERVPEHAAPGSVTAAPPSAADRENSVDSRLRRADADEAAGSGEKSASAAAEPAPPAKLGTGHGARERSYVEYTDFMRAGSRPNELVRIRYDSRDNLIALGIIPRPVAAPVDPNPFPGSPLAHFVPDPPPCSRGQARQCVHD